MQMLLEGIARRHAANRAEQAREAAFSQTPGRGGLDVPPKTSTPQREVDEKSSEPMIRLAWGGFGQRLRVAASLRTSQRGASRTLKTINRIFQPGYGTTATPTTIINQAP